VLESCAKSRVFRPPNPWTMAIMNVLAELHQEADLKLNLKFEIEVLCKTLSIDVGVSIYSILILLKSHLLIHYNIISKNNKREVTKRCMYQIN